MEEKENKTKDLIIKIEALLIVLCSIVLVILIINRNKTEEVTSRFNSFDVSSCKKSTCNLEFKFNGNIINAIKESNGGEKVLYNNLVIFSSADYPALEDKIYTFDDSLLFVVKQYDGIKRLLKYHLGNNEVSEIKFEEDWYLDNIKVNEGNIKIDLTRFKEEDVLYDKINNEEVKIDNCEVYEEFKDRDAFQLFEMNYEDNKFSEPKFIEKKILENYKTYSSLCNKKEE